MQMFIACTSSLIAGYILYEGINYQGKSIHISTTVMLSSIVLGNIALFTYQNGFGCFFIPFFIQFIASKKITKPIYIGITFSIFIYFTYFFLYKYTLSSHSVTVSSRSSLSTDPLNKLLFLLDRPSNNAFHFTLLFNEKSITGFIV